MRLLWRFLLLATLVIAAAIGGLVYLNWTSLERQWVAYQVGSAASFGEAQEKLYWFESPPDATAKLRELVRKWATGNQRFDYYLARHVQSGQSTESLRQAFSLEFAWRDGLLPRWAHYWAWQTALPPAEEIASIVAYLDKVLEAEQQRPITWREVLELQAIFQQTGNIELARRLDPENWATRYARWRERHPAEPPRVERPELPLPDWQGPLPETRRGLPRAAAGDGAEPGRRRIVRPAGFGAGSSCQALGPGGAAMGVCVPTVDGEPTTDRYFADCSPGNREAHGSCSMGR